MANIYPSQTRSVDPYSTYASNSVNRLTRMITRGENCLHDIYSIDVEVDSTSPLTYVVVTEGTAFMGDVYIKIDSELRVDFEDRDFYLDVNPFNEDGYYYVVLDYYYVKAKPAPEASIKILKPSQRAILDTSSRYILLKVVDVFWNGSTFEINPDFLDYDPDTPTRKRTYANLYCGVEDNLPVFDISRDVSRLIYVRNLQEFYYGSDSGEWEAFSAVRDAVADAGACTDGQLAYLGSDGILYPAIGTDSTSFAICVVLSVTAKKVRVVGRCNNVPVETGITVNVGDRLYLSETEAGSVTNVVPGGDVVQYIGSCIEEDGSTCSIWFVPNGAEDSRIAQLVTDLSALDARVTALEGATISAANIYREVLSGADWISSAPNYYGQITHPAYITGQYNIVQCYDTGTTMKIIPLNIEAVNATTLRIWMPTNTISVQVVIIG